MHAIEKNKGTRVKDYNTQIEKREHNKSLSNRRTWRMG